MSHNLQLIFAYACFGVVALCWFVTHKSKEQWKAVAHKIKGDFDKASDDLQSQRLENEALTRIAKNNSYAYKEQSERMALIVAENQRLRRSNAQLKRREGVE